MSEAADFAEGRSNQPPRALRLAWRCKEWQSLPYAGGLFDQPLRVMREMETALRVHEAFTGRLQASKAKKMFEWAEANPGLADLCEWIEQHRHDD